MANAPDQFLLYDTAVRQFVQDNFSTCVSGKTFNLMVGTPDRAFSEFVTPTGIDPDGRPPLPRAALTLGDPEIDPTRWNAGELRKLGFTDATQTILYRAAYPVPIRIPYTLNFWAEYVREMNLFTQQLLMLFKRQYVYIQVDLDSIAPQPVYGTKLVGLFADGAVAHTGDVEPNNEERIERRTFPFYMNAWLWDFNFDQEFLVKEFVLSTYSDRDFTQLLETKSTPQSQILVEGVDGIQTVFNAFVNPQCLPIIPNTFLLDATVGATAIRARDDGSGGLADPGLVVTSGSVNYVTGEINVTFATPPDAGTDLIVKYFTTVDTIFDD